MERGALTTRPIPRLSRHLWLGFSRSAVVANLLAENCNPRIERQDRWSAHPCAVDNQLLVDLVELWRREEQRPFTGWDFSYLADRMVQELPA